MHQILLEELLNELIPVSYTHLRAHETTLHLVCRLLLEKKIHIGEDKLNKKSITSIAVVAHEIGHAIQDKENYKPLIMRQKLIEKTMIFQRIGSFLLVIGLPSIFAFTKSPVITFIAAMIIMGCLSTNVLIHLITLPVEFDASFKRALPILQKYVPKENMKQCRSVLRAAALTLSLIHI